MEGHLAVHVLQSVCRCIQTLQTDSLNAHPTLPSCTSSKQYGGREAGRHLRRRGRSWPHRRRRLPAAEGRSHPAWQHLRGVGGCGVGLSGDVDRPEEEAASVRGRHTVGGPESSAGLLPPTTGTDSPWGTQPRWACWGSPPCLLPSPPCPEKASSQPLLALATPSLPPFRHSHSPPRYATLMGTATPPVLVAHSRRLRYLEPSNPTTSCCCFNTRLPAAWGVGGSGRELSCEWMAGRLVSWGWQAGQHTPHDCSQPDPTDWCQGGLPKYAVPATVYSGC